MPKPPMFTRGDIVNLRTDTGHATGTVTGYVLPLDATLGDTPLAVVAWHTGRTWMHAPGDLRVERN